MPQLHRQHYADLAADAYEDRKITPPNASIPIGGRDYKVLAVHSNPKTGYQGAVYQDVQTHEIIAAHRGTEPPLKDWLDAKTDLEMVLNRINQQTPDADILTAKALRAARDFHNNNRNLPAPQVIQVGHSLGGTHAQIQAYRHNMQGVTINAYGAAALHGIPEGGSRVSNYIKASDPVPAAAPHYGREIVLAVEKDLIPLRSRGYANHGNNPTYKAFPAAYEARAAHSSLNFVGRDSVLSEPNYTRARTLAEENRHMIEDYRSDVRKIRGNTQDGMENYRKTRELIDNDPNMMSYTAPYDPAHLAFAPPDLSQPLNPHASDEELIDYGFAALLADDGEMRDRTLESLMATDAAKQFERDSMQAALDYDREQEMLRPRGPVMSL